MRIDTHQAHLTYCSNIHPGESWEATFANLKTYTTQVKEKLGTESFGIGLRLSDEASKDLLQADHLASFQSWLQQSNMYVFTINGFPYGGFHHQVVKDDVHKPDWTTNDRLAYTKRLFDILAVLLPEGMDGGVSTSPISYRFWHKDQQALDQAKQKAAQQIAELTDHLIGIKKATGKSLHLDMEPEPDGILETTIEYVDFFQKHVLPEGIKHLKGTLSLDEQAAEAYIREHFQLCYDVCHFAVGFEKPAQAIANIEKAGLKIGRIQISAALGTGIMNSNSDRELLASQLSRFDEPTYLHQAVAKLDDGSLKRYTDLGPALPHLSDSRCTEMRTHFHVPVFTEKYEQLTSTQQDIIETLALWKEKNFTNHLEVETYTWDVLPETIRTDIVSSVARELQWVKSTIG